MAKKKNPFFLGTALKTIKEREGTITSQVLKVTRGKKKKTDEEGKK